METPVLISIQIGKPQRIEARPGDTRQDSWETGLFKNPVEGPVFIGKTNIEGDGQADLKVHGGADKAVCAYPAVHYPRWQQAFPEMRLDFGAFGENFTITQLDESLVCIGDTWQVGSAHLQISQPRQPCWKVARRWNIDDFPKQIVQTGRTGWYFRVLHEGTASSGDLFSLVQRPYPEWTVAQANRVQHVDRQDMIATGALAELPLLSASWRTRLLRRLG